MMGGDVATGMRWSEVVDRKSRKSVREMNDDDDHKSLNYQRRIFHDKRHKLNLASESTYRRWPTTNQVRCLLAKKINSRAFRSDKAAKITFHNWPSYRHISETWMEWDASEVYVRISSGSRKSQRWYKKRPRTANSITLRCILKNETRVDGRRGAKEDWRNRHHTSTNGKNLSHIRSLSSVIYHFIQWSIIYCSDVFSVEIPSLAYSITCSDCKWSVSNVKNIQHDKGDERHSHIFIHN